jgi:hypothetical protein
LDWYQVRNEVVTGGNGNSLAGKTTALGSNKNAGRINRECGDVGTEVVPYTVLQ